MGSSWIRLCPLIRLLAATMLLIAPSALAEPNLESGAKAYFICYNCHSLEPGVHLTGPSLAGVLGRKAGTVEGFRRYSEALRAAEITWTDATLDAWFKDPQALVPGNIMILRGMAHDGVRANLIAFLKIALAPGGAGKGGGARPAVERSCHGQSPASADEFSARPHGDGHSSLQ